jgi:CBS domain-containing protein
MRTHRYSQLPVLEDGRLRGIFSLWSLAQQVLDSPKLPVHDLAVEDLMEQLPAVTVDDALDEVLDHLNRSDAVVVRSPHGLQAIATATDALNYFARVARPFVLLQEIELSLRALIGACVSGEQLDGCIERALKSKYEHASRPLPRELTNMTLEDYRTLVTARSNWEFFEGSIGRNRDLVANKLERIVKIRNSVFHFREPVSVADHQTLAGMRNWLLDKARSLEPSTEEGDV